MFGLFWNAKICKEEIFLGLKNKIADFEVCGGVVPGAPHHLPARNHQIYIRWVGETSKTKFMYKSA